MKTLFKLPILFAITLWVVGAFSSAVAASNADDSVPENPSSQITQLSAMEGEGGIAVITIEASEPIQYTAFKLLNPLRLVLDLPKMQPGVVSDRTEVNKGVVEDIRSLYFQEADVLRLEIVLNREADYDIQKPKNNQLTIRLFEAAAPRTAKVPATMAPASGPNQAAEVKAVPVSVSGQIPEEGEEPELEDTCEPLLSGDKEKISLDFQGATLRNIFRIFSEVSGFNLILGPSVRGKINVRLLDVPWNQALEIILSNNGLGRTCIGENIVRIVSQETLADEEAARRDASRRKAEAEQAKRLAADLYTEVVRISYADINELVTSLREISESKSAVTSAGSQGSGGGRGRITVDVRTNQLIVTDIRETLDEMMKVIKILDVPTSQVQIEAQIVEVSRTFSQELGIQWGVTGTFDDKFTTPNSSLNAPASANTGFLVDLAPSAALAPGAASGFDIVLGNLFDNDLDLEIQLQALETQGKGRILSSPKVTTLDNKEAKISSGETIPYQTVSADGTQTEFVDAELSLTVTPHITEDAYVFMKIEALKNAADFLGPQFVATGVPTINTKEASTEVLVADGDTTVLGGIYQTNVTNNKEAVPFFSKIPLLGMLFQNYQDADDVKELLIFITPTIVKNADPYS